MSVIFMDPPADTMLSRGRSLHESIHAAIANPNKWVVRGILLDEKENLPRLHARGHSMKKNHTAKKNWQYRVARMPKNTFKALDYASFGLRYSDINEYVLVLFIKVTEDAI